MKLSSCCFIILFLFIVSAKSDKKEKKYANISDRLSAIDTTLKDNLSFPIGAAIKIKPLKNNKVYHNLLLKEFNSITAENAMKFRALHPARNIFNWTDADYIVDFAIKNGIRVHGHTLNWPKSKTNPEWVQKFQGDSTAWEKLLKSHIQTVVKHFKGKVSSWDVVNELFTDNGNYKTSIWIQKLGPGYIARCFQYAHEADPGALLFYNDYGHEYGGKKMMAILKLVNDFKKRRIPIHGLGLQMHTNVRMSNNKIKDAIFAAAATGLKVHLSELEVSVKYQKPQSFLLDPKLSELQALKYKAIFKAYNLIPKKQQFGITTWNVGDADSFTNAKVKNHDHPLLFDINYKRKPAYMAVMEIFAP